MSESDGFAVRSADGTSLAVWRQGDGPPILFVHGWLGDHTSPQPLIELLAEDLTTFSMDRRGRGESGDNQPYAIEREFEDVAAVVDAIADEAGQSVVLWGHSYGADCAMGAAGLTNNVSHLILYEPGLGITPPAGSVEAIEDALSDGDREMATVVLLAQVVEIDAEEIEYVRSLSVWADRVANIHTVPRELSAESAWAYQPGQFHSVDAPTLVLAGSESPPVQNEATGHAASAIPNARIKVLHNQGHLAYIADPAMVVEVIREFLAT